MHKILRPPLNLLPQAPRKNCNFSVFSCKEARSVDTENNNIRNFKDLQGMQRNAKPLKRNDGERKGILIGPSKLPRFSLGLRFHFRTASSTACSKCRLRAKTRGTDGKPANSATEAWEALDNSEND
jgi:hypothetical protein